MVGAVWKLAFSGVWRRPFQVNIIAKHSKRTISTYVDTYVNEFPTLHTVFFTRYSTIRTMYYHSTADQRRNTDRCTYMYT